MGARMYTAMVGVTLDSDLTFDIVTSSVQTRYWHYLGKDTFLKMHVFRKTPEHAI